MCRRSLVHTSDSYMFSNQRHTSMSSSWYEGSNIKGHVFPRTLEIFYLRSAFDWRAKIQVQSQEVTNKSSITDQTPAIIFWNYVEIILNTLGWDINTWIHGNFKPLSCFVFFYYCFFICNLYNILVVKQAVETVKWK